MNRNAQAEHDLLLIQRDTFYSTGFNIFNIQTKGYARCELEKGNATLDKKIQG
jgi:hypothetical protein